MPNSQSSNPITVPSNPIEALQLATKDYADSIANSKVSLTGDTMTGALFLPVGLSISAINQVTHKAYVDSVIRTAASQITVTPAGNISSVNVQAALQELDTEKLALTGGTMTGALILHASPTSSSPGFQAATKAYVDQVATGLKFKDACRFGSTANIPGYSAGTFTGIDLDTYFGVSGATVVLNDRLLVKDQTTQSQNGIYYVTSVSAGNIATITRSTDADGLDGGGNSELSNGTFVSITAGTLEGTSWVASGDGFIDIGTEAFTWVQFGTGGSIQPGDGLTKISDTLHVVTADSDAIVVAADSITLRDLTVSPPSGYTFAVDTTYIKATYDKYGRLKTGGDLMSSNGITVRTGANTYTNRSVVGTTNQITVTNGDGTAGNITLATPQDIHTGASPTFANLTLSAGGALRTATSAGNTLLIQARDVDGAAYTTFITLTANNTPTCDIAESVTKAGSYIYRAGGTVIAVSDGGTGLQSYTLGDLIYASGTTTLSRLAGNTTTAKQFLTQTGNGSVSAAPAWGTIVLADLPTSLTDAAYLTVGNQAGLTNERSLVFNATNFGVTDGGANGSYTVNTVQDIATSSSPTFANLNLATGGALRSATSAGNTLLIQARDVDGATYTTFITLTANNTPTCDLSDSVTKAGNYIYRAGGTDIPIADGGTGISAVASGALLYGPASGSALSTLAIGSNNTVLLCNGTAPSWGQVVLGTHTTGGYVSSITGTANQVLTSGSTGAVVLSTPQDIHTGASPTFANLNLATGGALRTATSAGNTLLIQARDVDGASYTTFITLTANNTPTCDLSDSVTKAGAYIYRAGGTTIPIADGGTGLTSLAQGSILHGPASGSALTALAIGGNNTVLLSNGTVPLWGAVVLGSHTTGNYVATIAGTANQITASASTGNVTLSLPSDLRAPGTFNAVTSIATGAGAGTVRIDASGNLSNIGNIALTGTISGGTTITASGLVRTTAGSFVTGAVTAGAPMHAYATDGTTTGVTVGSIIERDSSGAAADGFGTGLQYRLKTSTTSGQIAGTLSMLWTTAAHASRTAAFVIALTNNAGGSQSEIARFHANGRIGVGFTSAPTFMLETAGSIGPSTDNTYDLGSSGRRWANLYATNISGNVTPTGFAATGVVFGGTGGLLTQDTSKFFYDITTKLLSVDKINMSNAPSTAILSLPASTTSASSAPLKMAVGVLLTTAETGAFEYAPSNYTSTGGGGLNDTGNHLYFTPTSTNRKKIAMKHEVDITTGATGVSGIGTTTITVTHNLGTRNVWVALRERTTPYEVKYPTVRATGLNSVDLIFTANTQPVSDQYTCIIWG